MSEAVLKAVYDKAIDYAVAGLLSALTYLYGLHSSHDKKDIKKSGVDIYVKCAKVNDYDEMPRGRLH